ncbi:MAG: arsenic resistance protein [Clostridia bacterium]|nr:arsenic resistance protein [Clostridia bacterium]
MLKILFLLQKNLTYSIPLFMISGFFYGYLNNPASLKVLITPMTFLMVFPMMVTLDIQKVFTKGDTKLQLFTQGINFLIIPFLGLLVGNVFFKDNPLLIVGLLLTSLLPTSGMTISWTGFAKGNVPAAVKMTVIGLILGSFLTPVYLKLLVGTVIEIPFISVVKQIVMIVFIPMFLGIVTQKYLIKTYGITKYNNEIKMKFPLLSTLGVLSVVFISISLKAKDILKDPTIFFSILAPLIFIYFLNFLISTIVAKKFFIKEDGIALVYGTVMRNLSIALAIAINVFGEEGSDIALVIAVAYIIQAQAAAWYVKFTNRIF